MLGKAAIGAIGALAIATAAAGAEGPFVEGGRILQTFRGQTPPNNCTTACFGWAVSELGDVDRDRAQEAIVGEPTLGNGTTYVYSGRTGRELYRFEGPAPGSAGGYAMADAGDVDGDHVSDIVTGAPGVGAGQAFVYSGRTGRLLLTLSGEAPGDFFGAAVASAGDVDGDRRADILVGAPREDGAGANAGRAYVFSGRTGTLIRELSAGDEGDALGSGTDWTEDVNRDGVPDQIVGARNAGIDGAANGPGRVYVFSGRSGRLLLTIAPPATGADLGWFFVAGVGDVNRDRTPDVYAADFSDSANGPAAGRAAVYSGRDGSELLSWTGEAAGDGLGPGREAGDVNHDGRPDIAIGSYLSNAGAPAAGRIRIFSGKDGTVLRTITSTVTNENLGFDAVGIGDVNRDGKPDLLASAANGETVYIVAGEKVRKHHDD
jgi:hypothetical protein